MKKITLVSVIIPSWNGEKLLKTCLSSLKKQSFNNFEVIMVDNGSTDGSVDYIRKYFPEVKIIQLKKNFGFARAVNEGIRKSVGKYIFLLNNDTEINKDCLKFLVMDIQKKKVEFVVPKFLDFYQRDILELAGNSFVIDAVGHLYSTAIGKKDSQKFSISGFTFLAPGGGCLFQKLLFEKVGLFDEDYFLYLEDADFSLRAQLAGFKGWYEPKAKIYHIKMATSSKNTKLVNYLVFRNMMITVLKNYPLKLILTNFNWLKIILVILNTIKYFLFKGQIITAFKAPLYIIFNLVKILRKRKIIQSLKKVSDEYIISNIAKK